VKGQEEVYIQELRGNNPTTLRRREQCQQRIVTVRHGETSDDARARCTPKYGSKLRHRHGLIVVPAGIVTEQEAAFAIQQM
jgi:hypothetical protein